MSVLSSSSDIHLIEEAGQISATILQELVKHTKAGILPADLDEMAGGLCAQHKVLPAFLGVDGIKAKFPSNICISVNDEVLHGIPSSTRQIQDGDLVKLDFGIIYKGLYTDHCVSVGVGKISSQDRRLLQVAKLAVEAAAAKAKPGVLVGELGHTMESLVTMAGFDVLKEFIGHGIGHKLHEPPEIPAYGEPFEGEELRKGEVICVEAQVVAGEDDVYVDSDGWTVKTEDGKKGVMFEYMMMVDDQPKWLTDTRGWQLWE